ncbi:MAG: archaellin/type IV pilin N-terminal domain-containing protein [archaeon]
MKEVNRRGLSPVIASVLMILMVIVLASIVFLWARGFIGEQVEKFGTPIEDSCGAVNLEIARYGSELEVVNRGNIDIHSLDIKTTRGGDSEISKFSLQVDAGASVRDYVSIDVLADEIIAYPVLVGNIRGKNRNNVFTCIDAGVRI